ncbi:Outer membrane protein TolC [Salinimicrobium catena]|uniref:Outer membrane protein TolC n=1 Tax=Salinimicrobium catena TaxID=390640 RepID=A0A1H5MVN2_9FLAO|nr:TolC family protein [Salinimicrobium catena]SDL30763.1 Outer membrane protein TolC [Salinimicrobium catena]SEE93404.1 Outer membrane protein TolC [Salinimicrobium catena]
MKKQQLIFLLPVMLFGWILSAQETVSIGKREVLERVQENNSQLRISQQEFLAARAQYRQTNAVFLPNISVSHTGMTTNNPLMAFGSKLNQEIVTQSDFDPARLNDPDRIDNFATKVEVQQPLINFDGIYQRRAAKNKMQATELKSARTGDHMKLETEKAYMQLQLAHKAVKVLEQALETAEANLRLAENNFDQGYLQKSDVLAVEVRVTEVNNQLQYARSNVKNASDYLMFLMGDSIDVVLVPKDSLQVQMNPVTAPALSEDRADIQAMELAAQARRKMYTADKMAFLPRLNAFGSYELYDDELFQGDATGYMAGVALTWDLFDGSKRFGKAQQSKAEFKQAQLEYEQHVQKSQLELNKAVRDLQDAENKLHLTQLAMEQSKEALRIRNNRYEQGLEKTTDLLGAETQYSEKQLEYFQTVYEYNYAVAYLEFLTESSNK